MFVVAQINPESLFSIPSVTTTERIGINTTGLSGGQLLFDSDINTIFQFNGTNWVELAAADFKTLVMESFSASLPNANNTYYNFPLASSNVVYNVGGFNVIGNGKIEVTREGAYLVVGGVGVNNMPSGSTKYILAIRVNGGRVRYLTRGFASLPSTDWWGASGSLTVYLNANDVIDFQYVLNNGGTALNAVFLNFGISGI